MANYVDLEELRTRVFFATATLDDRFTFEEIEPDDKIAPVIRDGLFDAPAYWADDQPRFRITGCAHREIDQDGALCTNCGRRK